VHHNWRNRKSFPEIFVEALDSKGKMHKGNHAIENIWYLNEKNPGRWFMVSISENPYWVLPEGNLALKFKITARETPWGQTRIPPEGEVAISEIFLMPVLDSGGAQFSSFIIEPESGEGDWQEIYYDPLYATGFIRSSAKGSRHSVKITVPVAGYYCGLICALSPLGNYIDMGVENNGKKLEYPLELKATGTWALLGTPAFYLEKGECILSFITENTSEVMLDYCLLLPQPNAKAGR
jgi:hypothetical protein